MNLIIGKTYTFSTASPVFLGSVIESAKLKAIVDADTARLFKPIDQLFASIYPSLPAGTPNDVTAVQYYVFEGLNGAKIVMAETWIVESSIKVIEHVTIKVEIPSASLADVETVRLALAAAGVKDFVISTT